MKVTDRHRRYAFEFPDRVREAAATFRDEVARVEGSRTLNQDAMRQQIRGVGDNFDEAVSAIRAEYARWIEDFVEQRRALVNAAMAVDRSEIAQRASTLQPVIAAGTADPSKLLNALERFKTDLAARQVLIETVDSLRAVGDIDDMFEAQWEAALGEIPDGMPAPVVEALTNLRDAEGVANYVQGVDIWAAMLGQLQRGDRSLLDMRLPADELAYEQEHGLVRDDAARVVASARGVQTTTAAGVTHAMGPVPVPGFGG